MNRRTRSFRWIRTEQCRGIVWLLSISLAGCSLVTADVSHRFGMEDPVFSSISIKQGITITEVTSESALVWIRTEGPRALEITLWGPEQGVFDPPLQVFERDTTEEKDFIEVVSVTALAPNSFYEIRASVKNLQDVSVVGARFSTARSVLDDGPIRWVWSGDLGGQGFCRKPDGGYLIFDHMRETHPDFAVLLGDLIYGDGPCPSPPNIPGSDFVATSLDEFRAKHRYQREDRALRQFLASVPVYAQWDDHEVRNDFSGSTEVLTQVGLQGFHGYWPIVTRRETPYRLYRQIHRGVNLDLFFLDTRQYRSPNTERDGSQKTMLGKKQVSWLQNALTQSQATW